MKLTGQIGRQIFLLTLLVVIVPLVVFPERLGTPLAKVALLNFIYEFVFYGMVVSIFYRKANLAKVSLFAVMCSVYRLSIGTLLGFLIFAIFSMNFFVSLKLSIAGYIPGLVLHILVTPFILRPVFSQILNGRDNSKRKHAFVSAPPISEPAHYSSMTNISISKTKPPVAYKAPVSSFGTDKIVYQPKAAEVSHPAHENVVKLNGFDKAVRYIGEVSSVNLVTLTDNEGLLLAAYTKGEMDAEDWAPYSLMMFEKASEVTNRMKLVNPEKLDMINGNKRVICSKDDFLCLMVIADVQADDLLNIRVNQGIEIARKYISERYNENVITKSEKAYV